MNFNHALGRAAKLALGGSMALVFAGNVLAETLNVYTAVPPGSTKITRTSKSNGPAIPPASLPRSCWRKKTTRRRT